MKEEDVRLTLGESEPLQLRQKGSWKDRDCSHQLLNASWAQVWCLFWSVMYLIMWFVQREYAFTTDSSPLLNSHTKKIFVMTTSSWRKPVRPVHVLTSSSAGTISLAASKQRAAVQSHWALCEGKEAALFAELAPHRREWVYGQLTHCLC